MKRLSALYSYKRRFKTHKQNCGILPRIEKSAFETIIFYVIGKMCTSSIIIRKQFTKLHATVNVVTHELHTQFSIRYRFLYTFSICLTFKMRDFFFLQIFRFQFPYMKERLYSCLDFIGIIFLYK